MGWSTQVHSSDGEPVEGHPLNSADRSAGSAPARDSERCDDCRRRVGEHHDNMCIHVGTVKAPPARDSDGAHYVYRSVTGGHVVAWTRGDDGVWRADDDRSMTATDADIREAREATTPTPAGDSRVELLNDYHHLGDERIAEQTIRWVEAAGLVVRDPDDPETIERIARELHQHDSMALHSWDDCNQGIYRTHARWVLGALRGSR